MAERLALFVSGGGTTMNEMLRAMNDGRVSPDKIVPAVVIASKPDIGAIDKARGLGVPVVVVNPQEFKGEDGVIDREGLGQANKKVLIDHRVTVATLNGYTPRISPIVIWHLGEDAIFNQHPADPKKFGQLYGKQTHAAVLDFSDHISRSIVTFATAQRAADEVDRGAVVVYQSIPVEKDTKPDHDLSEEEKASRFAARVDHLQKDLVLPREHEVQILLVRQIGDHLVKEVTVPSVVFENESAILARAKAKAIQLYPNG